ncbi:MAG: hypothetical protein EOO67_21195 [Microbacterium sp.]|nr:MAG: hypothetical protein EOO67_21195 [Microbacterium sp.]
MAVAHRGGHDRDGHRGRGGVSRARAVRAAARRRHPHGDRRQPWRAPAHQCVAGAHHRRDRRGRGDGRGADPDVGDRSAHRVHALLERLTVAVARRTGDRAAARGHRGVVARVATASRPHAPHGDRLRDPARGWHRRRRFA